MTSDEIIKIARCVKFLLENMHDERDESAVEWVRESARDEYRDCINDINSIIGDVE
jgi:hypothetical protein